MFNPVFHQRRGNSEEVTHSDCISADRGHHYVVVVVVPKIEGQTDRQSGYIQMERIQEHQ